MQGYDGSMTEELGGDFGGVEEIAGRVAVENVDVASMEEGKVEEMGDDSS
jgi:hypothetical protein